MNVLWFVNERHLNQSLLNSLVVPDVNAYIHTMQIRLHDDEIRMRLQCFYLLEKSQVTCELR